MRISQPHSPPHRAALVPSSVRDVLHEQHPPPPRCRLGWCAVDRPQLQPTVPCAPSTLLAVTSHLSSDCTNPSLYTPSSPPSQPQIRGYSLAERTLSTGWSEGNRRKPYITPSKACNRRNACIELHLRCFRLGVICCTSAAYRLLCGSV